MKSSYIVALFLIACVLADPPTPFWGGNPVWTTKIRSMSKNSSNPESSNMTAQYFYNWNVKGQRYNFDANQNDQMCRITGYSKWKFNKCNVIYAKDGWVYVEFPDDKYCCKCLDTFGGVRYDWLQQGGVYDGRDTFNGIVVDKWYKLGNPALGPLKNYYYVTVGDQKPIRFLQQSSGIYKELLFDQKEYNTGPLDPSLFEAPPNCQTRCPGQCQTLDPTNSNLQTE